MTAILDNCIAGQVLVKRFVYNLKNLETAFAFSISALLSSAKVRNSEASVFQWYLSQSRIYSNQTNSLCSSRPGNDR